MIKMMLFKDRKEAGQKLAQRLIGYKNNQKVVVLGVPRGGVVVAKEVAQALGCPLDIVIARKIGSPSNPEFALGAVGERGDIVLNPDILIDESLGQYLEKEAANQRKEIKRRLKLFRGKKKPLVLKDRIVIIVDDGIATGSTLLAAIKSIRKQNPQKIIVAVPVAPASALTDLAKEADEVVCLYTPELFWAVGQFYQDFPQTEDTEVMKILQKGK